MAWVTCGFIWILCTNDPACSALPVVGWLWPSVSNFCQNSKTLIKDCIDLSMVSRNTSAHLKDLCEAKSGFWDPFPCWMEANMSFKMFIKIHYLVLLLSTLGILEIDLTSNGQKVPRVNIMLRLQKSPSLRIWISPQFGSSPDPDNEGSPILSCSGKRSQDRFIHLTPKMTISMQYGGVTV